METNGAVTLEEAGDSPTSPGMFVASKQLRDRRGCRSENLRDWPILPREEFTGPLGAHAYIQQCIRIDPANVEHICECDNSMWDEGLWQLEHLRQVALELSGLVVLLLDVCTKEKCPQMKASDEWVFLCAAHRLPQECCAIDYIAHTLEGTTAVLNSNRWLPARGTPPPPESEKVFKSIARRLHRIFAHVFFHHMHIFQLFEDQHHLCQRFLHLIKRYHWIKPHQLIIPSNFFAMRAAPGAGYYHAGEEAGDSMMGARFVAFDPDKPREDEDEELDLDELIKEMS
uniref:Mob1/phocein n=1 Tax=Pyramimonas obovata TaxID=1411642 RepID=A0A7S0RCT4_9CHLO|mmetsp:Transcript_30668/g.66957  ORF Transcript_30668/g.66957 Transcript_30668/m.66957 type:complete len:285 (+) Transcript_30668:238-1092(+)